MLRQKRTRQCVCLHIYMYVSVKMPTPQFGCLSSPLYILVHVYVLCIYMYDIHIHIHIHVYIHYVRMYLHVALLTYVVNTHACPGASLGKAAVQGQLVAAFHPSAIEALADPTLKPFIFSLSNRDRLTSITPHQDMRFEIPRCVSPPHFIGFFYLNPPPPPCLPRLRFLSFPRFSVRHCVSPVVLFLSPMHLRKEEMEEC